MNAIAEQLRALSYVTEHATARKEFQHLTNDLQLELEPSAEAKIGVIVDELHRRFKYAAKPVLEALYVPFIEGDLIDVDDACAFVATVASLAGVRCRFVFAAYRERCWTVRVAYESDGFWAVVDVLRQPWSDRLRFEEMIVGPILELE